MPATYTAELNQASVKVSCEFDSDKGVDINSMVVIYRNVDVAPLLSAEQIEELADQCPICGNDEELNDSQDDEAEGYVDLTDPSS